jgi:hypothetical protein
LDDKSHSKDFLEFREILILGRVGEGVCERGLLDEKYHSKDFS